MRTKVIIAVVISLAAAAAVFTLNRRERPSRPPLPHSNGQTLRIAKVADVGDATPTRRYKLGVLFPFIAAPFWVNEAYGVLDQAKKIGVEVVWLSADGYDNIDKQNGQIDDLATQGVDAILLAATSYTGTVPAVDRVSARGIPVFTHVTSSKTDKVISAVIDDDVSIGQAEAEFMGKRLNGAGTVAMINGPAAAEWAFNRVKGFKQIVAAKFPAVRIVAERFGVPDRAEGQREAEDLLTTFPKLDGIFAVADGMAMGVADAVKNARRTGITLTTASFSKETVPYIRDGRIALNVDENPVLMGRTVVNIAVRALNGNVVPSVVFVPNPRVTAENLRAVDATQQWASEGWTLK